MPMLSDPDRRFDGQGTGTRQLTKPATPPPPLRNRDSDESIRTEFCDGPLPEDLPSKPADSLNFPIFVEPQEERPVSQSRQDLIARIKRGENPTWAPSTKVISTFLNNSSDARSISLFNAWQKISCCLQVDSNLLNRTKLDLSTSAVYLTRLSANLLQSTTNPKTVTTLFTVLQMIDLFNMERFYRLSSLANMLGSLTPWILTRWRALSSNSAST